MHLYIYYIIYDICCNNNKYFLINLYDLYNFTLM